MGRFKADNATYKWGGLTSCVHNLIVGRIWIDHYGKFVIESSKSKASATCEFTQCGWFSRGWHKVLATIRNAKGDVEYYVSLKIGNYDDVFLRPLAKYQYQ